MLILACLWLAVLLRWTPSWWRWLNAGGAWLGRGIAWWCSGGLGWKLARMQIEQERRACLMARLQLDMATWRAERERLPGFPAGERVRALQQGGVAYPRHASPCQCTRKSGQRAAWD